MNIQFEFQFEKLEPVKVVKNNWGPFWHVMQGIYCWPGDVDQKTFASIEEASAFAKRHGADPVVGIEALHGRHRRAA
jgi:hypothetical protein